MSLLNTQDTSLNPLQLPTVLMIDATLPTFDQDSGSLRLFNLIKMLMTMGYKVTFFPDKKHPSHVKYQYILEALGVEVFMGTINEMLSSRKFTVAWLCRVYIAHRYLPFFRLLSQNTKIFYDTIDIHYIRELRQAEIENNPRLVESARNTKRKELSSCLLADQVITVTEEDGHHLQKELPQLTFSVIPNIHSISNNTQNNISNGVQSEAEQNFAPVNPGVQSEAEQNFVPFSQREGLIFIGHYRHKPNQDAVYYFVDTILPKIHAHLPDIKLYLIGSAMPEKMKALASTSIKIIGWVEQVEPEFAQRRVFVSPLRYGSGMKGKLGQALSLGLPVVTTPIGAEGMGLTDGETVLIADDPDSFAEAVCRLYSDHILWEKLSRQGQDFIEQHYGAAAVYKKLRDLLDTYNLLPNIPVPPVFENNLPVPTLTLPKFVDTLTFNPIHLPDTPRPRVSIIIPIFNKALYTYNCLLTVQACDQAISKEVIIINNASTDETTALLEQLQDAFTVINNSENQGFVQACRQGAEGARGEFLLFLNNDTQVMPGWLSNMLKVMDTDAKVGITGSKLIYPDGRLQEAGGIIFNDGSGYNYGRSQNPLLPQFNQSREVDYCSGASLMIRKTLWEQLGGFDLRYAPAYYEDTDLGFAARQAGYKVFYCHDSEVVHHEGITAGTDINTGYKAFQAVNRKKFQHKWREILSTHPPPQSSRKAQTLRYAQIEMTTTCNQRCYFCPISMARRPKNKLSLEKLDKILTELRAYPIETISIAGFSEPTYDKQIVEKVVSIRKAGFTVLFYTNGSGLKPALIDELLKAGVSRFTINLSTLDETQYEQTRGTKDIKHIIPYIDYLLAQVQVQTQRVEVILIMLGALDRQHSTNIQRITKQFAYSQVVQFRICPLGNYAGETTTLRVLPEPLYHKTLRGCARKYQNQWLHVTAQGEAILCCQDYHAKYKMGHIDDATVTQIYQGEKITQWRRWISGEEEAPEDFICRYCLFALTGGDSCAKRLQKLFCQSCVLPSMLGIENACRRCEVN